LILEDGPGKFAGGATAEADQPFLVSRQQFLVDSWPIVVAFEEGHRRHPDQILKTGAILGEQGQVVAVLLAATGVAFAAMAGGNVGLIADNRIDAGRPALAVKLDGPVEVAMIGQGDGVHAELLGLLDQLGDAIGAIEKAIVTVAMEMYEGTSHSSKSLSVD